MDHENAIGRTCHKIEFSNSCDQQKHCGSHVVNQIIDTELRLGHLVREAPHNRDSTALKRVSLREAHLSWAEFNRKIQADEDFDTEEAFDTIWQIAREAAQAAQAAHAAQAI